MSMTQTAKPTVTEYDIMTQAGHRITMQTARCTHCHDMIERVKVAPGKPAAMWGHPSTGRAVCLLPADTSKVATPR